MTIFIGNPADLTPVYAARLEVDVPSGTSTGTEFFFATLPTGLIMHASPVFWGALGASVTADFSLRARNSLVTSTDLVTGLDVSAAVGTAVNITDDTAKVARPIWHILGQSEDPNTDVDLIVTTGGAATSTAASVLVDLFYSY